MGSAREALYRSCAGRLDDAGRLLDISGDGSVDLRDAVTGSPTSLVEDAHELGLFVHAFTFRSEGRYLAHSYRGDPPRGVSAVLPAGRGWRLQRVPRRRGCCHAVALRRRDAGRPGRSRRHFVTAIDLRNSDRL